MRWLKRRVFIAEIWAATALGALGDMWAARAAARLRKLSANFPADD